MTPAELISKLTAAFNSRDIDTLIECFSDDYLSEQPIYPDRSFQGAAQVRKNWSSNFEEMSDFHATVISQAMEDHDIWTEWEWKGTRRDLSKLHMRGVTIFRITDGRITGGKLYMEPVKYDGTGIEAAVKEVMQGRKEQ